MELFTFQIEKNTSQRETKPTVSITTEQFLVHLPIQQNAHRGPTARFMRTQDLGK